MHDQPTFTIDDDGKGGQTLALSGPFLVSTMGPLDRELRGITGPFSRVDLGGVTAIDTVGAWEASRLAHDHDAEIVHADARAQRLLDAVREVEDNAEEPEERGPEPFYLRIPRALGETITDALGGMARVIGFLGQILLAFGTVIRHPKRFRGRALIRQMELVGVKALPIVGLMSFLIGIVIAQQGAVQLSQFGAETLTVNLVGRITLRELGVLMTAIMVAGRSGSAFAAQIGTMKLTEEVDAMRTIGISPLEALVLPRILAAFLMMPLLGFYACAVAIVGGAVVADVGLGIPFLSFLARVREVVPTYDLWVGLIKAPVFGLIIALAGCYHGMQVEGDSEQVGKRTTQAVVSAIFAVIVLDAFFAVFFTETGWA
ncbi:MAG: ABC transporter permease [Pontixanthobacter sp.]